MAKEQTPLLPDDMPVGIKPIYPMDTPNQPITLYTGTVELEQGTKKILGSGSVQYDWLPRPALRFALDLLPTNQQRPELEKCKLHLLEINWHADAAVFEYSASSKEGVSKVNGVVGEFELGQEQKVNHIIFHVPNFTNYRGQGVRDEKKRKTSTSRSVIEAGEWRITLDKIEDAKRLLDELDAIGGFAITHVGKLERRDGKNFAAKKSSHAFEVLFRYLSFCRGAWVAPILPVGFDEHGDRVWEQWRGWKIERWKKVDSWFNSHSDEGLSNGFPGFYEKWQDEKWKEPLLLSNLIGDF